MGWWFGRKSAPADARVWAITALSETRSGVPRVRAGVVVGQSKVRPISAPSCTTAMSSR